MWNKTLSKAKPVPQVTGTPEAYGGRAQTEIDGRAAEREIHPDKRDKQWVPGRSDMASRGWMRAAADELACVCAHPVPKSHFHAAQE